MELIQALGLDIKILIAQLVNFAVLVFILYKFGYKPMLSFLNDRQDKIEKGVKDAEKAIEKLEELETKEKEILSEAKKESKLIIKDARVQADKKGKEMLLKTKKEIKQIITQEKQIIQIEKDETIKSIKNEISDLVTIAVSKVLEEKVSDETDQRLIKRVVKQVNK